MDNNRLQSRGTTGAAHPRVSTPTHLPESECAEKTVLEDIKTNRRRIRGHGFPNHEILTNNCEPFLYTTESNVNSEESKYRQHNFATL